MRVKTRTNSKLVKARSSVAEHCFDVARVSGSIPLAPTKQVMSINMMNIERKNKIVEQFRAHETDSGSLELQVALLTESN